MVANDPKGGIEMRDGAWHMPLRLWIGWGCSLQEATEAAEHAQCNADEYACAHTPRCSIYGDRNLRVDKRSGCSWEDYTHGSSDIQRRDLP